jgi:dihydrolipoamide dehydrogenase
MLERFDLIVIGGGAAGITGSRGPAMQGQKIAMIEKSFMGGTCTNVGCMPTKALLASAHFLHQAKLADTYAVSVSGAEARWLEVHSRMEHFVKNLRKGSENYPKQFDNMTLYRGEARFSGSNTIIVDDKEMIADRILIAAGARSFIPRIPGLDSVNYLTSTTALALTEPPEHLAILGGGVLSVEFAQIFSRLGSKVTIIEQNDQILGNFDEDVANAFSDLLKDEGIQIITSHRVQNLKPADPGVEIEMKNKEEAMILSASAILIATGRRPNSDLLNLAAANVSTDERGFITTDHGFKTSADGIWAIGDIVGGPMFTHKARHDGMLISSFLASGTPIDNRNRIVPSAVYTDPEMATVGENEKSANRKNLTYIFKKLPYSKIGRAGASSKTNGFIKILVEQESKKIIGAQILGEHAGELIQIITMAMRWGGTIRDLQDTIPVHPTFAEGLYLTAMLFGEMI